MDFIFVFHLQTFPIMAIDAQLKEAILSLPTKEKDKMLIQLISKNDKLLAKLEFELIEGKNTLEQRRQPIRKALESVLSTPVKLTTAGWYMMDLRDVSGAINRHVQVTKDTYGEVELITEMVFGTFDRQYEHIKLVSPKNDTLSKYLVTRTEHLVKKMTKLHPDLQIEFVEKLNTVLELMPVAATKHYFKESNLPQQYQINYADFE
jgi:hypothetical protein